MTTDNSRSRHARRISIAIWMLAFVSAAIANVFTAWADASRDGDLFRWLPEAINQGSSIAVSLLLLPILLAACERWPLRLDTWRAKLPLYLLGSVAWTLLHVGGMVALRKLLHEYWANPYDYGPWLGSLLYEYGKDVQTFFLIVTIAQTVDWYVRLRQGEARPLSSPDLGVPPVPETATPRRPQRFLVRKLDREFLIDVDSIDWAQASGNYVNLHVAGRVYPLRSTMAALEEQLEPERFVRVHRSHIVNLSRIASIEPVDTGDARIHLHDGSVVPCSRRYRDALRPR